MGAHERLPVKVILDTDMGAGGCQEGDDVGTLCAANAMADTGEIELLAIVLNTKPDASALAISALQRYYGRDAIPIGAYKGFVEDQHLSSTHSYVSALADGWPSRFKDSMLLQNVSKVVKYLLPTGWELYRRVLAAQPDHSVVIVSVGVLTNLAGLMQSEPDVHSELSGMQLLARKVRLLAIMGGRYPHGSECNFGECNVHDGEAPEWCQTTGSATWVSRNLPSSLPVLFLGQEIGLEIFHGAALSTCATEESPARAAYIEYLRSPFRDRFSWDPLTLLVAVRGADGVPGLEQCPHCKGTNHLNGVGENWWRSNHTASQEYVKLGRERDWKKAGEAIDALLCQTPAHHLRQRYVAGLPQGGAAPSVEAVPRGEWSVSEGRLVISWEGATICLQDPVASGLSLYQAYWVGDDDEHDAGSWGGMCTCPDGTQFLVGDNFDWCESLACRGGTSGACVEEEKEGRAGHSMDCASRTPELTVYSPTLDAIVKVFPSSPVASGGLLHWQGQFCYDPSVASTLCFGIGSTLELGCTSSHTNQWVNISLAAGARLTFQTSPGPPTPPSVPPSPLAPSPSPRVPAPDAPPPSPARMVAQLPPQPSSPKSSKALPELGRSRTSRPVTTTSVESSSTDELLRVGVALVLASAVLLMVGLRQVCCLFSRRRASSSQQPKRSYARFGREASGENVVLHATQSNIELQRASQAHGGENAALHATHSNIELQRASQAHTPQSGAGTIFCKLPMLALPRPRSRSLPPGAGSTAFRFLAACAPAAGVDAAAAASTSSARKASLS